MAGRNRKIRRWRALRLSKSREQQRLSRIGKVYNPNKSIRVHKPILNRRFKFHNKPKGVIAIKLPSEMTFEDDEHTRSVLSITKQIRDSALSGSHRRITLEFRDVRALAPEVAVLLLAELQRCREYCSARTTITGTYPSNHNVSELLIEIGFFRALGVTEPKLPASRLTRTYVRIERQNRLQERLVDDLIDCFETQIAFGDDDRRRLRVGLVECIDNVDQHAYVTESANPHLYKEWWMAGFADHENGRVEFVFYDQGSGIANTIKAKQRKRALERLKWSDSRWIRRAVTKPISRFDSERRGHGLIKLRRFIDGLMTDGSLRVMANKGDYRIDNTGKPTQSDLSVPLQGTLVVWSMAGTPSNSIARRADPPDMKGTKS